MKATTLCSLVLLATLASCDKGIVEQRADDIHARNARLDQVSKAAVMKEVRGQWAVQGDVWFGKLLDGTVRRLEAPKVIVTPEREGKPFCCNWLGEATLQANRWQRLPAAATSDAFEMKYRALLESGGHYTVAPATGQEITPPNEKEIAAFPSAPNPPAQ
jgi:hypothetical protein